MADIPSVMLEYDVVGQASKKNCLCSLSANYTGNYIIII